MMVGQLLSVTEEELPVSPSSAVVTPKEMQGYTLLFPQHNVSLERSDRHTVYRGVVISSVSASVYLLQY